MAGRVVVGQSLPGQGTSKGAKKRRAAATARAAAQQQPVQIAAGLARPVIAAVGNQIGAQQNIAPPPIVAQQIVPAGQQPAVPSLLSQAKNWWASAPVNPKPLLHNYTLPTLRAEQTNANLDCVISLERMNERRAPHLWRLKDVLTNDLLDSLKAGVSDLKKHFLMTLELQKLSQTCIDKYLEKPHDAAPDNIKKDLCKRYSEAVEQFKKLNDTQKDVLDLFHTKLNVPLQELQPKKPDKAKEHSLAWTFCKEHYWFSAGIALSYTALIAPALLNIVGENYRFIRYGVPIAFIASLPFNVKTVSEAVKVAGKSLKALGAEYLSSSIILGPSLALAACAFRAPLLAKTVLYTHTAMFAGQLIINNGTDTLDEARDLIKKGSYKTLEVVKGYFRNGLLVGIIPSIAVGIVGPSWKWGAAVYGLHAAGFMLMKAADQPDSAY